MNKRNNSDNQDNCNSCKHCVKVINSISNFKRCTANGGSAIITNAMAGSCKLYEKKGE